MCERGGNTEKGIICLQRRLPDNKKWRFHQASFPPFLSQKYNQRDTTLSDCLGLMKHAPLHDLNYHRRKRDRDLNYAFSLSCFDWQHGIANNYSSRPSSKKYLILYLAKKVRLVGDSECIQRYFM